LVKKGRGRCCYVTSEFLRFIAKIFDVKNTQALIKVFVKVVHSPHQIPPIKSPFVKQILLLAFLLFFPLLLCAQYYEGSITLTNGLVKTGYIHIPHYYKKNIRFRETEKASTQKIKIDEVLGFEVFNTDHKKSEFLALNLANPDNNGGYVIDKKKSWVKVLRKGKLNLLLAYYKIPSVLSTVNRTGYSEFIFYVHKPGDTACNFIFETYDGHFFVDNQFRLFKDCVTRIFKTDCPDMVTALDKRLFSVYGPSIVVDLYQMNCGK